MTWWRSLLALWRKKELEDDLERELSFHLDQHAADLIANGVVPREARRLARLALGGPEQVKEQCRDARGTRWFEDLLQDLRYGVRISLKRPGFSLVAILTLMLGIGANTAIFSVLNALLLRPLPFAEADQLVMIWETQPDVRGPVGTYPDFLEWRAKTESFQGMAAFSNKRFDKVELTGHMKTIDAHGMLVSQNLFPLLGLTPTLGRNFLPEEEKPISNRVVILSNSVWRRAFANDPSIVGKSVQLDGSTFTVVGVMGEQYPLETDFWLPISHLSQVDLTDRKYHSVQAIGRLKQGVTIDKARLELETITERLRQLYPATNKNIGVALTPMRHHLTGNLRPVVLIVFAAVALVLLIACANVSNLLLAQSARRQRELAIRTAIGAGRGRLIRQLLVESMLLAVLGGIAGLALASGIIPILRSGLLGIQTGKIPGLETIGLDWTTLVFTFGVSLLTGLLFGALPALQISRINLNRKLKEGGKGAIDSGPGGLSRALIVTEVAMAAVVLVGAGLLVRSMSKLLQVDPGFRADHLLTLKLELPRSRYQKDEQVKNFYEQLTSQIKELPGVELVGVIDRLPLAPSFRISRFTTEGQQLEPGTAPIAQLRRVDHRFFETMEIPRRAGLNFDVDDDLDDNEVIINETLARATFQSQDPVGKRIFMHFGGGEPTVVLVKGVVADIKDLGLDAAVEPTIYWPGRGGEAVLFARTSVDPKSLAAALRQAVVSVDPAMPAPEVRSVEEILDVTLARRRFTLTLLCLAAVLALLLAAIGIYGLVAYSVAQRVQEIGIRLALGAQSRDVLKPIIGGGIFPVLLGLVLGLAAVFLLSRFVPGLAAGLLFEVQPTDLTTFAVITLLLLVVALMACYLPARRGTKVDPVTVLKHD
jgi:predicted permease